ncbi:adenylate kinase 9 isoform X2 [Colletes latitarsis]|uniref:adenylate kinase 9 isoform X2 n=1 Tax=Colletes latitarsis TaxID=2605962 RepID=UPI004036005D
MCDGTSSRERRDRREDDGDKFYASASFIIKKSFFPFVKGYPRKEYVPSWPKPHGCVYPKANAYYAFHEDANPFDRFAAKCQSRQYGNVQPHFESSEQPYASRDPFCETDAKQKYLESKPTCFAIFGKPDLNTIELATMIADAWNCVLISQSQLVKQEIEQGTEKGKIIADILKAGECLGPDIIVNLIENRINKRDVLHRGYVVEGLPLIPNEILDYSSYASNPDKDSNDRHFAQNYAKFFGSSFERICGATTDLEESERTTISSDERIKNKTCTVEPNYESVIFNQVEEIFTTWPVKPSIIVYAICPDTDATRKRGHFRINAATGRIIDTSHAGMNRNIDMSLSDDRNVSFEFYRELMNKERILDEHQSKYLLKRLADRKSNVETQCKLYKRFAIPAIEKWILLHNPQNVIRVDGRASILRMFQITIARLCTLPVTGVIIPKRLMDPVAFKYSDESPTTSDPMNEFEGKSNEEAFQYLTNRETVSPAYPWGLSPWNFLCPVELTRGRTVEGLSKYAVRFMNYIFFLSSLEATELFIENPRTFLLPFSPRPTCKIVVFGPKYSGKSDLCKTLARVFGGTIINAHEDDVNSCSLFGSSICSNIEEDTNAIIKNIQDISKEEIDVNVWRDGGYVVDGMCLDIDNWKMIVEDQKIVFEDAILLFDEEPYEYLLSKWRSIHDVEQKSHEELGEGTEYMENSINMNEDDEGEEEETQGLVEYIRHIQQFELEWEEMKETVANACKNLVTCNLSKIDNVSKYVIENIKNRYRDKARIMSDEEKEREKDIAEFIAMTDNTEIVGEQDAPEDEGRAMDLDVKEDSRRFGDTNYYCPVALLKYNTFWKGKEDFAAVFMNKVYFLSSATALEEFLRSPQSLSLPFQKPLSTIPPLRVSIVGPPGSGKSTLADAISREYGLVRVDYFNCFTAYTKSRAMLPLSRRAVLISPEDFSEEVELPEDLNDIKYIIDAATVQTFVRRYWRTGGVLPKPMIRECLLRFFEGLYNLHGIVFEQFPSCPEDVETALKTYAVPEIIIQLRCGKDKAYERVMPELLKSWQETLEKKKRVEYLRYVEELDRYQKDKETWIEKILNETIDDLRMKRGEEFSYSAEDDEECTLDDDIDPEIIESKRLELEETWREENPEPVLFTDWENFETAKQRIEREFEKMFDNDIEMIDAVRNALENETIPYVVLDGERTSKEVLLQAMKILTPYANRDISVLENTYTVDLETAGMLLDCGHCLQSSFGRWCPVQLHENKIPLQMFLPLEAQQEIYPVIHRQFIYFLGGKDARSRFLKNPFKYLEQDSCSPVVPFRLSIIGPPKCGKTTLANRVAKTYGVKVVTRGVALRHVLKHLPWTESTELAESRLRQGHLAPEESLASAVETYTIDPRSTSQGFVLDGFPANRKEYEELTFLGSQPTIVLDLKAHLAFCLDCSSRDTDGTDRPLKQNFSDKFLAHRYASWDVDQEKYRDWLKKFTQNVIEVDATKSTWHIWTRADREICSRYERIRLYFRESDYDKCHDLTFMNVSPYEFKQRQSRFESYCPLCLFYKNIMKTSGPPPDHRGMVQFREHFYWICPQHTNDFVRDPQRHLPPINTARLPEDRPRILTETVDAQHPCWATRLRIKGFCLVTYVDNLPNRKLVSGKPSIGVLYKDKAYLFCTEECRDKFLERCEKYANVDVKFLYTLPAIDVKHLPRLGFLEQTVASRVPVPDARFDYLCEYFKPASKVPAFLNVVDIAGLVKGAAEGQGLGNNFLSHINACDGIFHLCRAFDDDDVTHIEGDVNPVRDLEIISEELRLKDIEFLNVHLEKLEKLVVRGNDKKLKPEYDTLLKVRGVMVDEKKHIRFADWSATDIEVLNKYLFLTSKPVIYLVNLSEKDYIRKKNKWLIKIKEWVDKNDPGAVLIPFSGAFENKLADMNEAERAKYLEEQKATSALDKIIIQGYKALQLQYFFTAGHDEVKAWTIQKGTKAPQAAGKIHTDFEKGFIMAEVMKYDDFKNEGSEAAVKAAGKYRQQGRNYVVEDGDIIFFKFNAGAGLKDAKKK